MNPVRADQAKSLRNVMAHNLIDVWNVKTYGPDILAELDCEADLICQYVMQDKENYSLRELDLHRGPPPSNPYAFAFYQFTERVILPLVSERSIRGWHYTRLTDAEADLLRREGIYPSTLATIRRRLDALVTTGLLSPEQAEELYRGSPFHHPGQTEGRSNKFWMTAFPLPVSYHGIVPFLESWGGEGVFFWQRNQALRDAVALIGNPRVIELSVPLKITQHAYSAARAILAHYGRSIGCEPDGADFELYATQPLSPDSVLAIHSDGDASFKALANGYPAEYVPQSS